MKDSNQNASASNRQVVALLSLAKELYELKTIQVKDYYEYPFHLKLSDLPTDNPFIHINYPLNPNSHTSTFPDDEDGHPCLMWIERPAISLAPDLGPELSMWCQNLAAWNDYKIDNSKLLWHPFMVTFSNIPQILPNLPVDKSLRKLDDTDIQLFSSCVGMLTNALIQPSGRIPKFELSAFYEIHELFEVFSQIKRTDYLIEANPFDFKLRSWSSYTSEPYLIDAIQHQIDAFKDNFKQLKQRLRDNADLMNRSPLRQSTLIALNDIKCNYISFEDNEILQKKLATLLSKRQEWIKQRHIENQAESYYLKLDSQYHEMNRSDDIEMISATGVISYHPQKDTESFAENETKSKAILKEMSKDILHPVLSRRVRLVQDIAYNAGRFLVYDNAERCDLYSAILVNFGNFNELEAEYTSEDLYPWTRDLCSSFLRHLANKLLMTFVEGDNIDQFEQEHSLASSQVARIIDTPLLLLRKRPVSLPAAVNNMITDISDEDERLVRNNRSIVPIVVRDLVSARAESSFAAQNKQKRRPTGEDVFAFEKSSNSNNFTVKETKTPSIRDFYAFNTGVSGKQAQSSSLVQHLNRLDGISQEILLTKPANKEQLEIAENIERASAVLVQGPPGTGKTHTIANLLGHFLSQGKTVLVISQNSKALRVLKDKVDENLRCLCISVLEESNKDTFDSINGMVSQYSVYERNIDQYRANINSLRVERNHLANKLCKLRYELEQQLNFEQQRFTYNGDTYSTSQIAAYVAKHEQTYGKILPACDKIMPDIPLDARELAQLYASNSIATPSNQNCLQQVMPVGYFDIGPAQLDKLLQDLNSAEQNLQKYLVNVNQEQRNLNLAWNWEFKPDGISFSCAGSGPVNVRFSSIPSNQILAIQQKLHPDWGKVNNPVIKHAMFLGFNQWIQTRGGNRLSASINVPSLSFNNLQDGSSARNTLSLANEYQRFQNLIQFVNNLCGVSQGLQSLLQPYRFSTPSATSQYSFNTSQSLIWLDNAQFIEIRNLLSRLKNDLPERLGQSQGLFSRLFDKSKKDKMRLDELLYVNGHGFETASECKIALKWLELQKMRQECGQLWDSLLVELGCTKFSSLATDSCPSETVAQAILHDFQKGLNWAYQELQPLSQALHSIGVQIEFLCTTKQVFANTRQLELILHSLYHFLPMVLQVFNLQNICNNRLAPLKQILAKANNTLRLHKQKVTNGRFDLIESLIKAIEHRDGATFRRMYEVARQTAAKQNVFRIRKTLIAKLATVDPALASEIEHQRGIHGATAVPQHFKEAWDWRNLSFALNKHNECSITQLQGEIVRVASEYRQTTAQYAAAKAWYAVFARMDTSVVKALKSSATLLKAIGKGTSTSKRMEGYKRDLKSNIAICRDAIPVWIMPLNKVFENFSTTNQKFDVLIVDEASQVPVYGIVALFLANKCIIVGDNKQVSPSVSVSVNADLEKTILSKYARDIRNISNFNLTRSLYDIAESNYSSIMLKEHFRCVPEIINFSNALSYDMQIKPLRDASSSHLLPAIVNYYVKDGFNLSKRGKVDSKINSLKLPMSNKNVNPIEAFHTLALLKACIENPAYNGKTFGIITMLGQEQLKLIEELIFNYIPPKEIKERQLLWGNSANFQGDERDVVFLCLVDSNETDGPMHLVGSDIESNMQSYNVAVSRAKDQLWVVSSINKDTDLKTDDIRYLLLSYAQNPAQGIQNMPGYQVQKIDKLSESPFEREVALALIKSGYKITQQYSVGSYRIDIVVHFKELKVALECDGERYHSSPEQVANDLERQTILERLGWKFVRIRGSAFYRNPKLALTTAITQLNALGIFPEFNTSQEVSVALKQMQQTKGQSQSKESAGNAYLHEQELKRKTPLIRAIELRVQSILEEINHPLYNQLKAVQTELKANAIAYDEVFAIERIMDKNQKVTSGKDKPV